MKSFSLCTLLYAPCEKNAGLQVFTIYVTRLNSIGLQQYTCFGWWPFTWPGGLKKNCLSNKLRLALQKGFFRIEREVNSGWPALRKSLWKEKSRNSEKIFRKMYNLHSGDTRTTWARANGKESNARRQSKEFREDRGVIDRQPNITILSRAMQTKNSQ